MPGAEPLSLAQIQAPPPPPAKPTKAKKQIAKPSSTKSTKANKSTSPAKKAIPKSSQKKKAKSTASGPDDSEEDSDSSENTSGEEETIEDEADDSATAKAKKKNASSPSKKNEKQSPKKKTPAPKPQAKLKLLAPDKRSEIEETLGITHLEACQYRKSLRKELEDSYGIQFGTQTYPKYSDQERLGMENIAYKTFRELHPDNASNMKPTIARTILYNMFRDKYRNEQAKPNRQGKASAKAASTQTATQKPTTSNKAFQNIANVTTEDASPKTKKRKPIADEVNERPSKKAATSKEKPKQAASGKTSTKQQKKSLSKSTIDSEDEEDVEQAIAAMRESQAGVMNAQEATQTSPVEEAHIDGMQTFLPSPNVTY